MKRGVLRKIFCTILFIVLLLDSSIFFSAYSENVNPNIYTRFPDQNDLMPHGDFDIYYEIDDTTSGIDTISDTLTLEKWDGISSWWPDISSTYITWSGVTLTGATYNVVGLPFWKYRNTFSIDDNDGNTTSVITVFYVDQPEFLLSTGSIDVWTLEDGITSFSDALTVTVRTVGAGFNVDMLKDTLLQTDPSNTINDWDGSTWFWYDQDPYTSNISIINTTENIATQTWSINTNGEKNQYQYNIQYGALKNDKELAAWDYTTTIDFTITLQYIDIDSRCKLDGIISFSCDV